jgi:hypothetical protein
VGCSNVKRYQPGTSTLKFYKCGPVTDLTNNRDEHIQQRKKQLSGQSWYARLSVEQKDEYIQRQRISCQQNKMAVAHNGGRQWRSHRK